MKKYLLKSRNGGPEYIGTVEYDVTTEDNHGNEDIGALITVTLADGTGSEYCRVIGSTALALGGAHDAMMDLVYTASRD